LVDRRYRILALNPIISDMFDQFDQEFLSARVDPRFDITVESLESGTETIESEYDDALVAPYVVDKVLSAERRGFHAAIISCFLDPGLAAARESSDIVVVGPGESAMLTSLALGDTFSIIDVGADTFKRHTPPPRIRKLGLSSRFVSQWGSGITVKSIGGDEELAQRLTKVAQRLEKEDEPDVIILGCTGLSKVAELVAAKLPVPLVDPQVAALRMAESLVLSGLKHSRRTYPKPSPKSRRVPGARLLDS
jgi:allantoin racemase